MTGSLRQVFCRRDFEAYLPRLAPANDGGIALGQVADAWQVAMNENASAVEHLTCA
ncbi:hypothetical protein [Rhizobium etli]|uniref:hypothetical protein n=1 Tax=Rhizobium etli TaxID=29449 RepID=UPI0018AD4D40|nr:hypothetical protein [Rhizobium etli]